MSAMLSEELLESGIESFGAGVLPRFEDVRIIYNAPNGAGVVHA